MFGRVGEKIGALELRMFGRVGEKIGALELRVAFKEGKGLGSASGKPAGKGTILAGKGAVWDTVNIGEGVGKGAILAGTGAVWDTVNIGEPGEKGTMLAGKGAVWDTVNIGEVGKILLSRKEIADKLVGKILLSRKALADKLVGGAGDASSYRLHSLREADEELLGDLMYGEDFNANLWFPSRAQAILAWYGEDFNANLWFPSRAQAILAWSKDELAEPGQASIFDGYPDGGEGGGGDNLQQWVSRRSDEDVHAFKGAVLGAFSFAGLRETVSCMISIHV
ncbi:hypothetical protein T484DRAFT_1774198 [Baffinella frigidus]|nr:hypothetical protein T484DRAFT_1774198 [Cryptophyta sp. CCMP2293]